MPDTLSQWRLSWNNFFGDIGFLGAERAYGAVLRHAKRVCCWWIPGALKCFKGAGEPHRTPALMAGFNAVPCASAARRPAGYPLSWNNFSPVWVSPTPSGHTVRSSGTCPGRSSGTLSGISLFDCTGCSTHRPRNQLRGVATCRSGASARAAPDRRRPVHTGPATSCGASPPAEAVLRLGLRPTGGDP